MRGADLFFILQNETGSLFQICQIFLNRHPDDFKINPEVFILNP